MQIFFVEFAVLPKIKNGAKNSANLVNFCCCVSGPVNSKLKVFEDMTFPQISMLNPLCVCWLLLLCPCFSKRGICDKLRPQREKPHDNFVNADKFKRHERKSVVRIIFASGAPEGGRTFPGALPYIFYVGARRRAATLFSETCVLSECIYLFTHFHALLGAEFFMVRVRRSRWHCNTPSSKHPVLLKQVHNIGTKNHRVKPSKRTLQKVKKSGTVNKSSL